jgi:early secretory antigenic target protein ESAT-6
MPDPMLRVDFGALQHASDSINTALRRLRSDLQQVEHEAAPLVAGWEGDAQQAYFARQQAWTKASDNLAAMLGDIKGALDQSAMDYATTERDNKNRFI